MLFIPSFRKVKAAKKFDYIKKFQCNTNHYIISDSNIEKLLILGKNPAQKICAAFFAQFGIHLAVFSGGIVGRCFPIVA